MMNRRAILVVSESDLGGRLLSDVVRVAGASSTVVHDLAEMEKALQQQSFSLVLAELESAAVNQTSDLWSWPRQILDAAKPLPVVLCVPGDYQDVLDDPEASRFAAVILKPFSVADLVATLEWFS